MSDFIREVDEDYRQDQIRRVLLRYRIPIVAALVLILVGVGGWRAWLYHRQQTAEAAGGRYLAATEATTPSANMVAALDAIAEDAPAGYRLLARFRAAGETGKTDPAAGAQAFDALAADAGIEATWRVIARLRAALLLMDGAPAADVQRRLEPMADANAPFRNVARELLAALALKNGVDADAKRWSETIVADPTASPGERQRAGLYLALVRAGKPTASNP